MSFFQRLVRFVYGLILYAVHCRRLSLNELLKGKRVAIVGAANSTENSRMGHTIDAYDIVIRINKAPFAIDAGKGLEDVGRKIDILFHSFFESGNFGGGTLDVQLYDKVGVKFLVNPLPTYTGKRVTFNFYKKYLLNRTVYLLRDPNYDVVKKAFGSLKPTTGFLALRNALESEFTELYITGFTFFRTSYSTGYRESLADVGKLRRTMNEMKVHDPDLECREFIKLLDRNRSKNVIMDDVLTGLVAAERQIANEGKSHA